MQTTRKYVYVVDDEHIIANTLSAILRGSGYDAIALYSAEAAIASCERQHPDFVITDISLPGMNGIEMAMQLRTRFPKCGVLLFSGQVGTMELIEKAYEKGYDFELITKPVHPKDLLAKLATAIRRPVESEGYLPDTNAAAI
jgi:CheY-like chemotaxis protein